MGRYTGASCKQCRREGTKLFLKGQKCFTEKCPVERRPYAPGQHGQATARRRKASEYSKQLREKQKIKRIYGISEGQFRNTFEKVTTLPGITGHNLLAALESRLDNIVYRMGFAASRKAARQLIRHRHVEIGGKTVDIPSYLVGPGEEVRVRMKSREQASVQAAMDQASRGAPLSWIAVDKTTFSGRMLERPTRPNIPIAAQEQLVVELYSK
ncbi:MAG: 30S ribosomal protein S4 [Gemmatimonadaceae bacterium]|nr:30S ribosomal protein S4 [Gemmatimonadaceae bacterium]NUP54491.1 30S ribosomal protein S4 [Gemmatimonadaceae bacterium]NUQ93901.1 30S ribosomal protein S4 [Gemmatimonadaceae bacterium]NUR19988.1 30S ribosomal protein S4 [Gemmatimonadaceae bacterium]NUS97333.1 30S ribosomal protein S4 [Gemmatimonadaceae bacterium]